MNIRQITKKVISQCGFHVMKTESYDLIRQDWTLAQNQSNQFANLHRIVNLVPRDSLPFLIDCTKFSHSQIGQDLWVIGNVPWAGTFLEIGAFDGFSLSNTLLLEKFGWTGAIVEPIKYARQKDRNCKTINAAIGSSGLIQFLKANQPEYSTRIDLINTDGLGHIRTKSELILVESISVHELLSLIGNPRHFDYVSIDTEGNEYEILLQWDFSSCTVDYWTIETNGREDQHQIDKLMESKGYCFVQNKSGFDSWYAKHIDSSCSTYHRLI